MNRRNFLKSAYGLLFLIPFFPVKENNEPFNKPLSDTEFQLIRGEFIKIMDEEKRYIPVCSLVKQNESK